MTQPRPKESVRVMNPVMEDLIFECFRLRGPMDTHNLSKELLCSRQSAYDYLMTFLHRGWVHRKPLPRKKEGMTPHLYWLTSAGQEEMKKRQKEKPNDDG